MGITRGHRARAVVREGRQRVPDSVLGHPKTGQPAFQGRAFQRVGAATGSSPELEFQWIHHKVVLRHAGRPSQTRLRGLRWITTTAGVWTSCDAQGVSKASRWQAGRAFWRLGGGVQRSTQQAKNENCGCRHKSLSPDTRSSQRSKCEQCGQGRAQAGLLDRRSGKLGLPDPGNRGIRSRT